MPTENPKHRESLNTKKLESEFVKSLEGIKIPENATSDDILKLAENIFKKHNPDKFEEMLKKSLGKYTNERKIAIAKRHYQVFFTKATAQFYRQTENRRMHLEDARDILLDKAKKSRQNLMLNIQASINAKTSAPTLKNVTPPASKRQFSIPIVGPILNKVNIPIIGIIQNSAKYREYKEFQYQTEKRFGKFINAMNQKYLESKQHDAELTERGVEQYSNLKDQFKTGLSSYLKERLQYIFENSKNAEELRKDLQNLRDELRNIYTNNDKNNDGILDVKELSILKKNAEKHINIIKLINSSEDDDELYQKLKKQNFFNPESWKQATRMLTIDFINDVRQNGNNERFIKAVKKLTGTKKEIDFDDASELYKAHILKLSGSGVQKVIKTARLMNKEVNGERADMQNLSDIRPKSIHILVRRQRELILTREIEPRSIDDKSVAEFMSTNLAGRMRFLNNTIKRQALFQSIKNIKRHYPRLYNSRYRSSLPKKVSQLTTRSKHPDKPTAHDRIARMLAMITLANEAEWVIKNLDKTNNFTNELENTTAEKTSPKLNMHYRWRHTLYKTGYVSRAVRGGFNARDLGIGALKLWAGATMFFNFMNARKAEEGWLKGLANVISNPYFLGAGATIYGLNKYQQNPAYRRYLFQDAGGQETISTHTALSSLSNKKISSGEIVGKSRITRFINNGGEYNAMQSLMKNPTSGANTVKNLLQKARDKARRSKQKYPVLTKEELKDKLGSTAYNQLPAGNDRVRFLFYEKFLTSKRNIRELKANCNSWS